jgi:methionyl-tRNA formyltransferase
MELKPDRGDIVAQRKVPIEFKDTARTLFDKMTVAAAGLIAETYPLMSKGVINEVAQDHGSSTYFGGRKPEDGEIDWEKGARDIYNLIRAVTHPYPGAFTHYGTKKLFVWWGEPVEKEPLKGKKTGELYTTDDGENVYVATGAGAVRLICAQWEGKKKQSGKNLLHALDLKPGDMLRRDTKT